MRKKREKKQKRKVSARRGKKRKVASHGSWALFASVWYHHTYDYQSRRSGSPVVTSKFVRANTDALSRFFLAGSHRSVQDLAQASLRSHKVSWALWTLALTTRKTVVIRYCCSLLGRNQTWTWLVNHTTNLLTTPNFYDWHVRNLCNLQWHKKNPNKIPLDFVIFKNCFPFLIKHGNNHFIL